MNLSNFIELINAQEIQASPLSKLSGFCARIDDLKYANAFFTDSESEAKKAAKSGAYAIISSKKLKPIDSDICYLLVNDLQIAIKRLIKFLAINKAAYTSKALEIECFRRAKLCVLDGDIFSDLAKISANDLLLSSDANYLDSLSINHESINSSYQITKFASFFYHDVVLNGKLYTNLPAPTPFVNFYAELDFLVKKHALAINISHFRLLEFEFYNDFGDVVKGAEASRVVIYEKNEKIIAQIAKFLDIKTICRLENHKFMLFKGNKGELNTQHKKTVCESLFANL